MPPLSALAWHISAFSVRDYSESSRFPRCHGCTSRCAKWLRLPTLPSPQLDIRTHLRLKFALRRSTARQLSLPGPTSSAEDRPLCPQVPVRCPFLPRSRHRKLAARRPRGFGSTRAKPSPTASFRPRKSSRSVPDEKTNKPVETESTTKVDLVRKWKVVGRGREGRRHARNVHRVDALGTQGGQGGGRLRLVQAGRPEQERDGQARRAGAGRAAHRLLTAAWSRSRRARSAPRPGSRPSCRSSSSCRTRSRSRAMLGPHLHDPARPAARDRREVPGRSRPTPARSRRAGS